MQDNLNLTLLSGGKALCTPAWNRSSDEQDHCFKLYYIVAGSCTLTTSAKPYQLSPGHTYLIDGVRLTRMACPSSMEVYWLHFMPDSLFLEQVLSALPPILELPPEQNESRQN